MKKDNRYASLRAPKGRGNLFESASSHSLPPIGSLMVAMTAVCVLTFTGCRLGPRENRACYKTQCYTVELAMTDAQKAKGLQHRDQLGQDQGMLFFMKGELTPKFWMRETLIPLDMIWMDEVGTISYIEHDAVPCEKDPCAVYGPNFPAGYVLEINGGEASRLDMRLGERIVLDLKNVK